MRISELPEFKNRTKVLSCQSDETVYNAVVSMTHRQCGAIVIVDEKENILGIFTERDLLSRVVANGCDIETTKISDFMSTNLETVNPKDSVLLTMGRMSHGRFRHVPVVDDKGGLLGILSQNDFASYAIREMVEE